MAGERSKLLLLTGLEPIFKVLLAFDINYPTTIYAGKLASFLCLEFAFKPAEKLAWIIIGPFPRNGWFSLLVNSTRSFVGGCWLG